MVSNDQETLGVWALLGGWWDEAGKGLLGALKAKGGVLKLFLKLL